MSKECESKVIGFNVNLDDIICPACGLTSVLCMKEGHTRQGQRLFQVHCMNPECFGKTFKIFVKIEFAKETEWQLYEGAK